MDATALEVRVLQYGCLREGLRMSQHDQHWDRTRTLTGFSRPTTAPPPMGAAKIAAKIEAKTVAKTAAIRVGARVGRSGQVFEVDGGDGSGQRVIKLLRTAAGRAPEVVARFTHEATRVANLRHPHIVPVLDAGTLADGTAYVVMERLLGETLEETAEGRPLPTVELVSILRGVASALSAAHAVGVVHGAVSAENVFLVEVPGYSHGFPKLLDFGVTRLDASDGSASDARSDQRALAALACRLLTGSNDLADETADPRCPPVYRVLTRAMAAEPNQRFDSVASFFQALQAALLTSGAEPTTPATAPTSVAPPSSLTQQFFAEGERQERAQLAESAEAGPGVGPEDADASASDSLTVSGALDRLPRRRAPMLAAAAVALGSLAIVGFTVLSLSRAHHPATWSPTDSAPRAGVPEAKTAAPAPLTARARTGVRRARGTSSSTQPSTHPTEPPPLAPIGAPSATPTPAPAAATVAPPPSAPASPPADEDVTAPSEETEAAPIPGQPTEEAPPPETPATP
jgi:serine/threonine-protein kinase